MTPKEKIIYDMFANAARRGDPAPTNSVLAVAIGTSCSGAVARVNSLIAQGVITIERTRRSRVVTIVKTGQSTRRTELHRGAFAKADDLAEYLANGGIISHAHRVLGCPERRVRELWTAIRTRLGPQAR